VWPQLLVFEWPPMSTFCHVGYVKRKSRTLRVPSRSMLQTASTRPKWGNETTGSNFFSHPVMLLASFLLCLYFIYIIIVPPLVLVWLSNCCAGSCPQQMALTCTRKGIYIYMYKAYAESWEDSEMSPRAGAFDSECVMWMCDLPGQQQL